jgi:hypothetical protein
MGMVESGIECWDIRIVWSQGRQYALIVAWSPGRKLTKLFLKWYAVFPQVMEQAGEFCGGVEDGAI